MNLQAIFRFESIHALVTLENSFLIVLAGPLSTPTSGALGLSRIVQFFLQKLRSSSGISPQGYWGLLLLLGLALGGQGLTLAPCVKGEGEVGANGEGEVEGQGLASLHLADVQAFGCQGGVTFIHRSHCGILLN